jgi:hypothetical protein
MRFYGGSSFSKPENALKRAEGARAAWSPPLAPATTPPPA